MTYNYTNTFRSALELCYEETQRLGIREIDPDLLVWGVLKEGGNVGINFLLEQGFGIGELIQEYDHCLSAKIAEEPSDPPAVPTFDQEARICISIAAKICAHRQEAAISPLHLLQAVLLSPMPNRLKSLFKKKSIHLDFGFSVDALRLDEAERGIQNAHRKTDDDEEEDGEGRATLKRRSDAETDTPTLDAYGRDLVADAKAGRLDPMIGREAELERMIQILGRRKKSNPILVGEPGVGKTALVEGLAQRIAQRFVPLYLQEKRIISIDLAAMIAGTKYRGQYEERLKALMQELESRPDIILFIDEIHTIVGSGGSTGGMDTANMLKPALSRGGLQCIGTTTLSEYRKYIERDGALERRFQRVMLSPNTAEETRAILEQIKSRYEDYHGVRYSDEALEAIVELSARYLTERCFPDKAIDILDEVGANARGQVVAADPLLSGLELELEQVLELKLECIKEQKYELAASYRSRERELEEQIAQFKEDRKHQQPIEPKMLGLQEVAAVVARMSGIPTERIAQGEAERLRCMAEVLQGQVIGQDAAVERVVRAIQRSRLGLRDERRPIGSFLFLGPTGVGKTYLAKKLSQELFGVEDAMIRVDMSEYMEKFAVSRLIGSPPGYVGYEEGGQLTEQVRRRPYSVVLFDEIEKAHPEVYNLLLQILDEGTLTDSEGRRVDFRNTIVILTSNVGSREAKSFAHGVGFYPEGVAERKQGIMRRALEKTFSPEFLNRLDEIVEFASLDEAALRRIVEVELRPLSERIARAGYALELDDLAKDAIAALGYDPSYGARPLRRVLQREVEDRLTDLILSGELSPGDTLRLTADTEGQLIRLTESTALLEPHLS